MTSKTTEKFNYNTKTWLEAVGLIAIVLQIVFGLVTSTPSQAQDSQSIDPMAKYFNLGTQLSKQNADKLEQDLKSNPTSFAYRIELLAFYSFKLPKDGLTPEEVANRREHILWIIANQPSSVFAAYSAAAFGTLSHDPEGLQQGKKLWLQQLQSSPADARVLYNASRFFFWAGDMQQSKELLERAYAINPANHEIASQLAQLYLMDARQPSKNEQAASSATESLKVFEQALLDTQGPRERLYDLPKAALAAFEAGEYQRATAYSDESLSLAEQSHYRDAGEAAAIHYGNIVLGRIAIRHGDVATAAADLLKAGKIRGNASLDTFGPNMMLAKELLEKGERASVLEYFDLCGKFWTYDKDHDKKLDRWRSEVIAGNIPDFGANLIY